MASQGTRETDRGKRRRALFNAQEEIERRRVELIDGMERKFPQKVSSQTLLAIRWQVK